MMTETEPSSPTSTSSGELSPQKMDDKTSYRKSNKPLMEKKRRARINSCLSQLKSLVLQAMKKDNSQYSKLEKADILELTVKHLKNVQRYQSNSMAQVPDAMNKYRAGFNECANEVMRYLGESQGVNDDARTRILSHLASILTPINTLPLQPAHTPILPAPSPAQQQQQQHLQQLQLQQQQQQQSVFLTPPNQPLSIDTNNNKPTQPAFLSHSGSIGDIKQVISGSPTAFQSPIGTGISASAGLQLPCIASASMATTQLQLVPSTLPSGQVALVLAPQAIPAMNLYTPPQGNRQQQQHNHDALKLEADPAIPQKLGLSAININQSQPHLTRMEECKSRLSSNQSPVALITKPSQIPKMETSTSVQYTHTATAHLARLVPSTASTLSSSSSMLTNPAKYHRALTSAPRSKAAATSVIINNINNNNNNSGSVVRATSTWRPW